MEIKDYLYAIRRRLWLPVAVPLAAAVITAGIIYIQPEKYQATATVVVPALSAQGYSTSAVTQYVSTFKDVLISVPVVDELVSSTHEKRSDLVSGLTAATATASSNIIVVTYTGPNRKAVEKVARLAAIDSLDTLLAPQLSAATNESTTGMAALKQADQAISDFTTQTGLLFPVEDYKTKSQELSALIVQLTQAQLGGDKARVAGLQKIVDARQKELVALAPLVVQFQSLDQTKVAAQAVYNKALENLSKVDSEIASDHDARTVTVRNIGHVARTPEILKFGGVALAVALLLSLAFIVFMEFFRPNVAQIPYLRNLAIPRRPLKPVGETAGSAAGLPAAAVVPTTVGNGSGDHSNGGAATGVETDLPKTERRPKTRS